MTRLTAVTLALLGILLHSIGIMLQKKGANGLNFGQLLKNLRKLKLKITSDRVIWVVGLVIAYCISILPTAIASEDLSSQVMSAISGIGIVFIIVLSRFFLKEDIHKSDIIYGVIIIVSIFVLCISQDRQSGSYVNMKAFYAMMAAPFILFVPAVFRGLNIKTKALLYSSLSGLTGGFAYVVLNIAVKNGNASFAGVFATSYIYEYIIIGFVSGLFLQVAYKFGDLINIAPVQMSLQVIFPLVCSYVIFHKSISFVQDISIIIIAIACWLILKRH